jgi:hypothetical protein
MGWGDCKAGAGRFVALKKDGEAARVVILGEAAVKSALDKKGQTRKRMFVNAATADDIAKGESCSVLALNITTADALAKLLHVGMDKDGEPFPAKDSLVGKVTVIVTRQGAEGEIGTKYELKLGGRVTPAEARKLSALKMVDVEAIEFTGGK